ncbi:HAD family acid phosphatase [Streptomyces caniscabiei]|uniref:Hydrolase n=1 Tax=Streptomyces caniscabiei TaxID=2746961 RepID=A0A927QFQ7_9ACTN|nr:HAD family acid phosphatase [Streptomyces caniscabiei]MBD9723900.1 hydrolase [Streptomyces caniscabiei]MDX3511447.1 HAD family acid phosphatase [Streptomyces caniscabiei]MDX3718372.1 HAD family acid phosphatase [Streptomyces caniscabiei]MDX3727023.1 HAD family acid phosphatase [Streptomyces caniscabiei]WEO22215.1 HAD family acid phosphatase [Streptomyces caniscabiei]
MTASGVGRRVTTVAAVAVLGLGASMTAAVPAAAAPSTAATAAAAAAEVDYATWQKDVKAVVDTATPYIQQRTANSSGQKLAIVFDIDNTTLETHYTPWYQLPTPALKPSLALAKYAKSRGVAVFFVTARPGIIESLTEWNLENVGYPVDGLYVRDLPDLFAEVAAYKTASRADIESDGYTIIANVGNNTTDLVGGHAERTYKLPDYDGLLD